MPIRRLTPDSAIDNYIENLVERTKQGIIYELYCIGEQCLNQARSTDSYKDRTGNLRSSIGYVIVVDGKIDVISSFGLGMLGQGASEGEAFAKQTASKFPRGICLIVVAGMNYATYVSAKGYDVLDSSELLADKLVPQMLKKLGFKRK
jgi:hypothetical protein